MKKIFLFLLLLSLIFCTSCEYRLTVNPDNYVIISPNGTKYNLISNCQYCIDTNDINVYKSLAALGTITESSWNDNSAENIHEFELYEIPETDGNLLIYDVYALFSRNYCPVFANESFEVPCFESIDRIEALYFLSFDLLQDGTTYNERWEWVMSAYDENYIAERQLDVDLKNFIGEMLPYKIEKHESAFTNYNPYEAMIGWLVFKFKDTGKLYFCFPMLESDDAALIYIETNINGIEYYYAVPKDLLSKVLPT